MSVEFGAEYPWLMGAWQRLCAYLDSGRVPPALLIAGPRGLGKRLLAEHYALRLLCGEARGAWACGRCDGCRLAAAGSHPDLLRVEPEEVGKPIKVETIRETTGRLSLKPHYGGHRVVLVNPAEQMNRNAANGLLKSLEEPDSATVFLLVSDAPETLPVTVRSRCQQIGISVPGRRVVIEWLRERGAGDRATILCAMARGAPLPALALKDSDSAGDYRELFESWLALATHRADPVTVASSWEKRSEEVLEWLCGWVEDSIRIASTSAGFSRSNAEFQPALCQLAARLDLKQLFQYRDGLMLSKKALGSQINRQFLMEDLAIRWFRLAARPGIQGNTV